MDMDEVRFYYLRGEKRPFGCVAFVVNDDGTVTRGVSLCSIKDNFDRRRARGLAYKRLEKAKSLGRDMKFKEYNYEKASVPLRRITNPMLREAVAINGFAFLKTEDKMHFYSGCYHHRPTSLERKISQL